MARDHFVEAIRDDLMHRGWERWLREQRAPHGLGNHGPDPFEATEVFDLVLSVNGKRVTGAEAYAKLRSQLLQMVASMPEGLTRRVPDFANHLLAAAECLQALQRDVEAAEAVEPEERHHSGVMETLERGKQRRDLVEQVMRQNQLAQLLGGIPPSEVGLGLSQQYLAQTDPAVKAAMQRNEAQQCAQGLTQLVGRTPLAGAILGAIKAE